MSEILFRAKNFEKAELHTRTCKECGKVFRTPGFDILCPSCKQKHRKENLKRQTEMCKAYRVEEKKKSKPKISIEEEQRIERIYNAIHKSRYYGYGEIVNIIENTKADRCVCCGVFIPEGRMVCPVCERMAEGDRKSNNVGSY